MEREMKRFDRWFIGPWLGALILACAGPRAHYSPYTFRFLEELKRTQWRGEGGIPPSLKAKYQVRDTERGEVVHGVLQVTDRLERVALERLGVVLQTQTGDLYTALIPVCALRPLGKVRGVLSIAIDTPIIERPHGGRP